MFEREVAKIEFLSGKFAHALRIRQEERLEERCAFFGLRCPCCKDIDDLPESNWQLQHQILFWRTMGNIRGIQSPDVNLAAVCQSFIHSVWSAEVIDTNRPYFDDFYLSSPPGHALTATRAAACLFVLGSKNRHQTLIDEGRVRYVAGLQAVRKALQRPEVRHDDALLGAIYHLGQSVFFVGPSVIGNGWRTHAYGIYELFQRKGPKATWSRFALAVMNSIRPFAVMQGLVDRKATFLASPTWTKIASKTPTVRVRITNLSLKIGGLLEKADGLLASDTPSEDAIMSLLTQLAKIERDFQQWLLKFCICMDDGIPYRLADISEYPSIEARCGGHKHVFPKAIEFSSFLNATSHAWVWVCLLVIKQAVMDIVGLLPKPNIICAQGQETALIEAADECATKLCQTAVYLLQAEQGSLSYLACSSPLYFAAQWFDRRGSLDELAWAGNVRDSLQDYTKPVLAWWMFPDIIIQDNMTEDL